MKNKKGKIIVSIIGFIILIIGIAVGTFLVQQNQDIREKAAPATSVYISPSTQNKNPGNNFTIFVKMDTGENQVAVFDLRILFNPSLIEITSIVKGSGVGVFTVEQTRTFDNATGQINYVANNGGGSAVNGTSIEMLVINGKVKNDASGSASFTFDPSSVVGGMGETQNVIISSIPGTITITSGEAPTTTPTATATSTVTPTTTATSNATATATSVTTPTITATSRATTTATATSTTNATATSTATPTGGVGGSNIKTATPTSFPVPETGTSIPTIFGIGLGIIVIFGSLLLAL